MTTTAALASLALAALLGACGSGGEGSGGRASGDEAEVSAEDATLEYAQCMRDHGVEDFPDPEVGEDGELRLSTGDTPDRDFEDADAECRPILDEAQREGSQLSPEEQAERQDQAVALARCMRGKGWDMPDPEIEEGGGIAVQNPDGLGGPGDARFEEFERDMEACHDDAGLPTPEGGGELDQETGGGGDGEGDGEAQT